jgi:hypothetical protein
MRSNPNAMWFDLLSDEVWMIRRRLLGRLPDFLGLYGTLGMTRPFFGLPLGLDPTGLFFKLGAAFGGKINVIPRGPRLTDTTTKVAKHAGRDVVEVVNLCTLFEGRIVGF